jgi:hypothetical protein
MVHPAQFRRRPTTCAGRGSALQLENLTPANRRLVGFWRHIVEKRINVATGAVLTESPRAPSVIVTRRRLWGPLSTAQPAAVRGCRADRPAGARGHWGS